MPVGKPSGNVPGLTASTSITTHRSGAAHSCQVSMAFLPCNQQSENLGSSALSNLEALSTLAPERVFSCFRASHYKCVNLGDSKTLQIDRFINSRSRRTSIAWSPIVAQPKNSPGIAAGQGLHVFCGWGGLRRGRLPHGADPSSDG